MTKPEYLHWSEAGGPNECEHGYAEGIPCPNCDANPRVQELRAEVERLRAESQAQYERGWDMAWEAGQKELVRLRAEIARLHSFALERKMRSKRPW